MHTSTREGTNAGRAAAIEDRALSVGVSPNLVLTASTRAAAWLLDNPIFNDRTGERRAEYVRAYLAAYRRQLREA